MKRALFVAAFCFVSAAAAAQRHDDEPLRGRVEPLDAPLSESGNGDFDVALVVRMIHARRGALVRCYETQLRLDPRLAGRVVVAFTIGISGELSGIHATGTTLQNAEVTSCVERVVRGFRFNPGPEGGNVTYAFALDYSVSSRR